MVRQPYSRNMLGVHGLYLAEAACWASSMASPTSASRVGTVSWNWASVFSSTAILRKTHLEGGAWKDRRFKDSEDKSRSLAISKYQALWCSTRRGYILDGLAWPMISRAIWGNTGKMDRLDSRQFVPVIHSPSVPTSPYKPPNGHVWTYTPVSVGLVIGSLRGNRKDRANSWVFGM